MAVLMKTTRRHGLKSRVARTIITFGLGVYVLCQLKSIHHVPPGKSKYFLLISQ
jgi:hypothetical protein